MPTIRIIAAGFAVALMLTPIALSGGDLRSPDTRDAAERALLVRSDLRSPDTRDAAERIDAAQPAVVQTIVSRPGDFDWGDAGIGAAGALGLVALAVAVGALASGGLVVRTRHP